MNCTEAKAIAQEQRRLIDGMQERVLEHALAMERAECNLQILLAANEGKSTFHTRNMDGRVAYRLESALVADGFTVSRSNNGLVISWEERKP